MDSILNSESQTKKELLKEKIQNLTPKEKWHLSWTLQHPEYEERPVDISTFINSPDYMNAKNECWEPIKEDLKELFQGYNNPQMEWKYNEAAFDEGIGAGKSYKASVIIEYLIYRILILKDPQSFLKLAKGSSIYFINMSVRSEQAKKIVFGEIVQRVYNSSWFKERNYLPSSDIKSELRFPKNINVIPGNSKETFPLGFNLLGGVMDEAAWYTETNSHDVAEEIFNALHNRIKNRFGNKGMLIMISSPRYIDDFIEKKMSESNGNSRIYAVRRTSWDSKPKSMFSGKMIEIDGLQIPEEYEVEARRNFDRFKRDYMAIPSLALEPYFRQWELIKSCIDSTMSNPVIVSTNRLFDWFKGNEKYSYYMHIDLSLVSDATGIAMVHKEGDIVKTDLLLKIIPPENREIDLFEIRSIVVELKARGFHIKKCTFDQFQSASSIQELNKLGIQSEQLSVDRDMGPYETLKELFYTNKIRMYESEDLLRELERLELVKGKKVDHPTKGSKDLSDALAGAVFNCVSDVSNFNFGFGGQPYKMKTEKEMIEESKTMVANELVPYGYYRGRR